MRNVFEMPVMSISVFDVEDVITTSMNGQPMEETAIDGTYATVTANWNTTSEILSFE